jgi:hypothetical protein
MEEADLDLSDPLTPEAYDAYYERTSDTIYLNLSSEWPADFVDWNAYISHYLVPLLVHEYLHGTLYNLSVERSRHHWAIEKLED